MFLHWKPHLSKPCSVESVTLIIAVEVELEGFHGLCIMAIKKDLACLQ